MCLWKNCASYLDSKLCWYNWLFSPLHIHIVDVIKNSKFFVGANDLFWVKVQYIVTCAQVTCKLIWISLLQENKSITHTKYNLYEMLLNEFGRKMHPFHKPIFVSILLTKESNKKLCCAPLCGMKRNDAGRVTYLFYSQSLLYPQNSYYPYRRTADNGTHKNFFDIATPCPSQHLFGKKVVVATQ